MVKEVRHVHRSGGVTITYWARSGLKSTKKSAPASVDAKAVAWLERMKNMIAPDAVCGMARVGSFPCKCAATLVHCDGDDYENEVQFFSNPPMELIQLQTLREHFTAEMCSQQKTRRHILGIYEDFLACLFAKFKIAFTTFGMQSKICYLQPLGKALLICPCGLEVLLGYRQQWKNLHDAVLQFRQKTDNKIEAKKRKHGAVEAVVIGKELISASITSKTFNLKCLDHLAHLYSTFSDIELSHSMKRKGRKTTEVLFPKALNPVDIPNLAPFYDTMVTSNPMFRPTKSAFLRRFGPFKQRMESYDRKMFVLTRDIPMVLLRQKGKNASQFLHGTKMCQTQHACDVCCFPVDNNENVLEACFAAFVGTFGYNGVKCPTKHPSVTVSCPGSRNLQFIHPKTSNNNQIVDLLGATNHEHAQHLLENIITYLVELKVLDVSDISLFVKACWIVEKMSLSGKLSHIPCSCHLQHNIRVQVPWSCYEPQVLFDMNMRGTKVIHVVLPVTKHGGFLVMWTRDPNWAGDVEYPEARARLVYIKAGTALVIPATVFQAYGFHSGFAATIFMHLQIVTTTTEVTAPVVPDRTKFHFCNKMDENGVVDVNIAKASSNTCIPVVKLRELANTFLI